MGFVCVNPRPSKLPACGSRLGGLVAEDGSLTDSGMLGRVRELFFTPEFLKILYDDPQAAEGSRPPRRGRGSGGRSRPGGGRRSPGAGGPSSRSITGPRRRSMRTAR